MEQSEKLLQILNSEGACQRLGVQKFAKEHNIPILRQGTASLLISLIRLKAPLKILEVGTAIGYSGTLILENAPKGATLDTLEKDSNNAKIAREHFKNLGLSSVVKIYEEDAISALKKLKEPYDFIFLDGPKGQYLKYLPYLVNLLKPRGVLFGDNVLYQGMVLGKIPTPKKKRTIVNNLKDFLEQISTHEELDTQIIDLEDGVSISIKRN